MRQKLFFPTLEEHFMSADNESRHKLKRSDNPHETT